MLGLVALLLVLCLAASDATRSLRVDLVAWDCMVDNLDRGPESRESRRG